MKIRFTINVAGTVHEIADGVQPGDVLEVDDEVGARYCKLRYAVPVVDTGEEHATPEQGEERAAPAPPRRGRPPAKTA